MLFNPQFAAGSSFRSTGEGVSSTFCSRDTFHTVCWRHMLPSGSLCHWRHTTGLRLQCAGCVTARHPGAGFTGKRSALRLVCVIIVMTARIALLLFSAYSGL